MANQADRAFDAAGGIGNGISASSRIAGDVAGANSVARAALPIGVAGVAISEGYSGVQDYSNGMSLGRSVAIHGVGAAGAIYGADTGAAFGFALGEVIFPLGGGVPGAIIGGILGAYGGNKAGQAIGGAAASAAGACR